MRADEFDYELPRELIAQQALPRGRSRLLVLQGSGNTMIHARIRDLAEWLCPGDLMVANDSRVFPARLHLQKPETGARIEVFLHEETSPGIWEALAKPCRRLKTGMVLKNGSYFFKVLTILDQGRIRVQVPPDPDFQKALAEFGETPLPPYIRRPRNDGTGGQDRKRYQTIFARHSGSVAAPTAGLHFSAGVLDSLRRRGVELAFVTLHVGWGTFAPLPEGDLEAVALHSERYEVSVETAAAVAACRKRGGRVVACGTTAARVLETCTRPDGTLVPGSGRTRLFIQPGYVWKGVQGLLTNFHLPRSSLLMLVAAFGGREAVLAAYREAVREEYRFFSYGDAMLLLER